MTQHEHDEWVDGCFRCDLAAGEVVDDAHYLECLLSESVACTCGD